MVACYVLIKSPWENLQRYGKAWETYRVRLRNIQIDKSNETKNIVVAVNIFCARQNGVAELEFIALTLSICIGIINVTLSV